MNIKSLATLALRVLGIAYVSVAFALSAAFMLFGIGMEGMRHMPSDGSDHYLFECCIPAGFFGFMLLVSLWRFPTTWVITGSIFAVAAVVLWFPRNALQGESGLHGFYGTSAAMMLLAFFTAWLLHIGRQRQPYAADPRA